ncbi:MAG: hypothetical protein V1676_04540 [Candidatus Diapherotrites archaeon]
MVEERFRNDLRRNATVRIKFEHLNPNLQILIKNSNKIPQGWEVDKLGVNTLRGWRKTTEGILAGVALWDLHDYVSKKPPSPMASATAYVAEAYVRQAVVNAIHEKHVALADVMQKCGILATESEGNYPRDWSNPAIVKETHPIFSVQHNGDLVFRKNSRREYLQYCIQKKWPGKFGLNPWNWRVYLKPPTAPEKIRVLAVNKLREMAAKMPPIRAPFPVPVPVRAKCLSPAGKRKFYRR